MDIHCILAENHFSPQVVLERQELGHQSRASKVDPVLSCLSFLKSYGGVQSFLSHICKLGLPSTPVNLGK